mmetsp:Transcript_52795/g.150498  ORF Transcript_52795/g.150498 Transcript_52795/m.150498 type:complete len:220 (-) Transcript_52795:1961-2620(-)
MAAIAASGTRRAAPVPSFSSTLTALTGLKSISIGLRALDMHGLAPRTTHPRIPTPQHGGAWTCLSSFGTSCVRILGSEGRRATHAAACMGPLSAACAAFTRGRSDARAASRAFRRSGTAVRCCASLAARAEFSSSSRVVAGPPLAGRPLHWRHACAWALRARASCPQARPTSPASLGASSVAPRTVPALAWNARPPAPGARSTSAATTARTSARTARWH